MAPRDVAAQLFQGLVWRVPPPPTGVVVDYDGMDRIRQTVPTRRLFLQSESECAICFCSFDRGEPVQILRCGHAFHLRCTRRLDPVLYGELECVGCPTCRVPFTNTESVESGHGGKPVAEWAKLLMHAAKGSTSIHLAEAALESGVPVDAVPADHHYTALQYAAHRGDLELAALCIQKGASPNKRTATLEANTEELERYPARAFTALHLALLPMNIDFGDDYRAVQEHNAERKLSVTRLLLQAGADPWAADADGNMPLHLAVSSWHVPTVELVLEWSRDVAGFDVNAVNDRGDAPIHLVARYPVAHAEPRLLHLLLEAGADASLPDGDGQTVETMLMPEAGDDEETAQAKATLVSALHASGWA